MMKEDLGFYMQTLVPTENSHADAYSQLNPKLSNL